MDIFTELTARVAQARSLVAGDRSEVSVEQLPFVAGELSDPEVMALLGVVSEISKQADQLRLAVTGVINTRSARSSGHTGLAQQQGFRNTVALLQGVTGVSSGDAHRQVRASQRLLDTPDRSPDTAVVMAPAPPPGTAAGSAGGSGADSDEPTVAVWHHPVSGALRSGRLTVQQSDAILRGLGEPAPGHAEDWSVAAAELAAEAGARTVEELRRSAAAVRDLLDPCAADERFRKRYAQRSFTFWTDADGVSHASIVFDDESAAYVRSIIDTALRPRRGGPRFVSDDDRARAKAMREDERTNEQLAFDLFFDLIRSGALADAETVFGVRQAGLRLVRVIDAEHSATSLTGRTPRETDNGTADAENFGAAFLDDTGTPLPASYSERHVCNSGAVPITIDSLGNPLDMGHESRLYTPKQRIALALRDGGCRWHGCDRPASFCEAHHIDEWAADNGRTDIDRGILLCAFHHLQLHNNHWRITRDGKNDFVLHPPKTSPPGAAPAPITLRPRAARQYQWNRAHHPTRRFRLAA